jgi:hypothetical protein
MALAGGRREVVQAFDLPGAQLDVVGRGALTVSWWEHDSARHQLFVEDLIRPGTRIFNLPSLGGSVHG